MTRETQASIADWATATFGEPSSDARVAARVNEEFAELLREWTGPKRIGRVVDEAADVTIVLYRLATRRGVQVQPAPVVPSSYAFQLDSATKSMSRLMRAAMFDNWGQGDVEIQRLFNCLWLFCRLLGLDLDSAIDAKMAINRTREWQLGGDGHGYHKRAAG